MPGTRKYRFETCHCPQQNHNYRPEYADHRVGQLHKISREKERRKNTCLERELTPGGSPVKLVFDTWVGNKKLFAMSVLNGFHVFNAAI